MSGIVSVNHPLLLHHLAILRSRTTKPLEFRQQIHCISTLLAVKATEDLPVNLVSIETPLAATEASEMSLAVAIVPILRAGLGMVDAMLGLLPDAEVWHLGIYRDEATSRPVEYYSKLPDSDPCEVAYVLDPMLATGGSVLAAIESLQNWGCPDIRLISIIASQPGIDRVHSMFPHVRIVVAAIDPELNADNYIVPGLGDAGDRFFNTERW
ncbi:MAG: uracil phosphoribosyltransferase [Planctomycetales bacterium]|nr:uracil phosphoribosyltransferase [Planctomycetales bacterium]